MGGEAGLIQALRTSGRMEVAASERLRRPSQLKAALTDYAYPSRSGWPGHPVSREGLQSGPYCLTDAPSQAALFCAAVDYFTTTLPFIIAMWPGKVQKKL